MIAKLDNEDMLQLVYEREYLLVLRNVLKYAWDFDRRMDVDAFYDWCRRLLGEREPRDPVSAFNDIESQVRQIVATFGDHD